MPRVAFGCWFKAVGDGFGLVVDICVFKSGLSSILTWMWAIWAKSEVFFNQLILYDPCNHPKVACLLFFILLSKWQLNHCASLPNFYSVFESLRIKSSATLLKISLPLLVILNIRETTRNSINEIILKVIIYIGNHVKASWHFVLWINKEFFEVWGDTAG